MDEENADEIPRWKYVERHEHDVSTDLVLENVECGVEMNCTWPFLVQEG